MSFLKKKCLYSTTAAHIFKLFKMFLTLKIETLTNLTFIIFRILVISFHKMDLCVCSLKPGTYFDNVLSVKETKEVAMQSKHV